MTTSSHLSALELRLSHEKVYLSNADSDGERQIRKAWISQIEKEIQDEKTFLGIKEEIITNAATDAELLELLGL